MRKWLILLFLAALFPWLSTGDADARKTRDLVFEEDEELPAKPETDQQAVVAVKTTVELDRNGRKSTVLPDHPFQSGDKVRFMYTTNIDCYVYWLSQGSSGSYTMLFPSQKAGLDNWVKKNESHSIPVKGTFKFDENPGVEKILMVMAPEKIPELENAVKEASTSDGKVVASAGAVGSVSQKTESRRKTRDLVFEEEDDADSGISTQVQVSKDIKQPFVNYYELTHK